MQVAVFGEALFDCFENGDRVPGGAPFNVAWHLQALGDAPLFVSRFGMDQGGEEFRDAMRHWGMKLDAVQEDKTHATGDVKVVMKGGEPTYEISENRAYDFISAKELPRLDEGTVLYHGTLALRNTASREALEALADQAGVAVFVDVNLRDPWWDRNIVSARLKQARWGKLNLKELDALGYNPSIMKESMARLQDDFELDQVIVTCGEQGVKLRCSNGRFYSQPAFINPVPIDTLGAGDAFCAMYIHGLGQGWAPEENLTRAQQFASKIVGKRGAIVEDPKFYRAFNK